MNNLRKQSAVKKVNEFLLKPMSVEEAIDLLKQDEANYTEDEIKEISAEFPQAPENAPAINEAATISIPSLKPVTGNVSLDLSGFDYKNLTGESFRKYVELVGDRSYLLVDKDEGTEAPVVGKLKENDMYDFQLFKVDVVMKTRFPGVANSPQDFNGVKIKTETPEHTTRIPVKIAHELNAQILNAHSRAGHGKYYLLKK